MRAVFPLQDTKNRQTGISRRRFKNDQLSQSLCSQEIYADFRANFFADKAKICRHTFVWQEFLTQYATKFAEKTQIDAYEHELSEPVLVSPAGCGTCKTGEKERDEHSDERELYCKNIRRSKAILLGVIRVITGKLCYKSMSIYFTRTNQIFRLT